MDIDTALQLAREDAEHLRTLRKGHPRRGQPLLVDGSMLSPAWRALPGGARVHDEGDDLGNAAEAYAEELDDLTDDIGYWADGCFWGDGLPAGAWANDA
jgi:hypothetical protein